MKGAPTSSLDSQLDAASSIGLMNPTNAVQSTGVQLHRKTSLPLGRRGRYAWGVKGAGEVRMTGVVMSLREAR